MSERDAPLDPPVQVGRERDVAEAGQAVGRLLDVVADAEDLLKHDDAGTRPGLGEHHVGVELAVGSCDALYSYGRRHGREP